MNPSDSIGTETTVSEIQARHDEHYKNHGWNPNGDIGRMFEDVKFLLSDHKRLETEIRLLREVVKAADKVFYEDLQVNEDTFEMIRSALDAFDKERAAEFDKSKAT